MKISWTSFQSVSNFENDQFKHCTWQGEIYAENKLNHVMSKFVIFEQLFHEKYPTNDEKHKLSG